MSKAVRLDKFLADAGKGTRSEVKKIHTKRSGAGQRQDCEKTGAKDNRRGPGGASGKSCIHGSGVCVLHSS